MKQVNWNSDRAVANAARRAIVAAMREAGFRVARGHSTAPGEDEVAVMFLAPKGNTAVQVVASLFLHA